MDRLSPALTAMAGVLMAVISIAAAVRLLAGGAWRAMRQLVWLVDELAGRPAHGQDPGRPSLMQRLATLHSAVLNVTATVEQLDRAVADLDERVARIERGTTGTTGIPRARR